jgi:tetratricopeptide (TPR) repeat protein
VLVELQTGNGTPINQTVTNNEGDFHFGGLFESSYTVIVNAPDHEPASEIVQFGRTIDENTIGESRTIEITLISTVGARITPARAAFVQNVPEPARAAYNRASKLVGAAKSKERIAALRESVQLFPDYFDAHLELGSEFLRGGELNDAITEFDHARRVNPKDDRVYYYFGQVMLKQRKSALAAAVFAEAARLNPNEIQYPLLRGSALIDAASAIDPKQSKQAADDRNLLLDEATKSLTRAYELSDKKLAAYHKEMARVYERRGDKARTADELEAYLRKSPNAPNAAATRELIKTLRSQASN